MGGQACSSREKSSNKKRNKISSKLLKMKKKKSGKKESKVLESPDSDSSSSKAIRSESSESDYRARKNKSKKRRRDDSASSYSDDHSITSASESLSAHNNKIYKRRKTLPEVRKRRARKRFESADSDAESRRRKKSRRHHVVKLRNRPLKKKSRRYFTNSSSSGSESCSTCDSSRRSNSTGDGKHRRSKMILAKKIKSSRDRESRRARRKRKARSPSGSYCSTCGDHDVGVDQNDRTLDHDISVDHSDETFVPGDNSRRLKSVITFVNRPTDEEENRWAKDPQKEEILCDHDDYPSPKSMDSNEGVDKSEADDQSHGASCKRIRVENAESEVILPMKSGNQGYHADDSRPREVHTNRSENERQINVSVNFTSLDGDKKNVGNDMELILRQKALENLRRFQGGLQSTSKSVNLDTNNEYVNESPIKRNDNSQNKCTEPNSLLSQKTNKTSSSALPAVKKDSDSEHMATDPPKDPVVLANNDTNQAAGEHDSKEQPDEAKNVSEFEKKTMSVMRGGEVVQVSYKVYIPQRAPALARKQLRR